MCKQISISLLFLLPLKVTAAAHPTALELLDKYAANQNKLKSFIAKTEALVTRSGEDAWAQRARTEQSMVEFRYEDSDSGLGAYYSQMDLKLGDDGTWVSEDRCHSVLWDGKLSYDYDREADLDSSRVVVMSDQDYIKGPIAVGYAGAGPVLGLLYGDVDRFDSILRRSGSISARNELERVGLVDCYVIDANSEHGSYAVWLDPEHGYGIAKAVAHKGLEDLLHGRPLTSYISADSYKGQSFFMENVRLENIEGIWVPMEADCRTVSPEQNGTRSVRVHYKITQMDIDPNHAELRSFVLKVENGTRLRIRGFPGINYTWQEGMKFVVDEWNGRIHYVPEDWSILVAARKPLPKFEGIKLKLSAEQTKNGVILLCFFDMNQRSSRHCVTQVAKKAAELKERDVLVVAVQAAPVSETSLGEWTKKYKIPFPVGMITADIEKTRFAWGVRSLPWLILSDSQHVVSVEGFSLDELGDRIDAASQAVDDESSHGSRVTKDG